MFSQWVSSKNSSEKFFAQPKNYMNTEEMLKVIRKHTLEAFFQVMRVAVSYLKGQKPLIKVALYLKSTLTRTPIYDQAYPDKLSTASPGNLMGVTKPSSILLFAT